MQLRLEEIVQKLPMAYGQIVCQFVYDYLIIDLDGLGCASGLSGKIKLSILIAIFVSHDLIAFGRDFR